jgi:hypothetical protein
MSKVTISTAGSRLGYRVGGTQELIDEFRAAGYEVELDAEMPGGGVGAGEDQVRIVIAFVEAHQVIINTGLAAVGAAGALSPMVVGILRALNRARKRAFHAGGNQEREDRDRPKTQLAIEYPAQVSHRTWFQISLGKFSFTYLAMGERIYELREGQHVDVTPADDGPSDVTENR